MQLKYIQQKKSYSTSVALIARISIESFCKIKNPIYFEYLKILKTL